MNDTTKGQFVMNPAATRTQCAALCWRMFNGALQVLLVTSRDTGRWVIPKGWPISGLTGEASAAREAWEEAGVEGKVQPTCIGLFGYDKILGHDQAVPCIVAVYPLKVARLRHRFPERKERRRKWFSPDKAAIKVGEPDLRALLAAIAATPGLLQTPAVMAEPATQAAIVPSLPPAND